MNFCTCGEVFSNANAVKRITDHLSDATKQHIYYMCPMCGLWHHTDEVQKAVK